MSLIDSYDLANYSTRDELAEITDRLEDEISTLRGFKRGAEEKLKALIDAEKDDDE